MATIYKNTKSFDDLIIEQILFCTQEEQKKFLNKLFPTCDVTITPIDDVGGVRINVGSAEIEIHTGEPKELTKQQNVDNVCDVLEEASNRLRGQQLTLEQWEQVRQAWVSFAKTFTPCHPKYWQEVVNEDEFNFDRAMDLLK